MPNKPPSLQDPEVQAALIAPHLSQARQEAELSLNQREESPSAAPEDPKAQPEYTWAFDWKDARGRRWKGTFTNRVVTLYQRRLIGLTRARALGGVPVASVDMSTLTLIHMSAWLQTSLTAKPEWFSDPDQLHDDSLVAAVFEEVAAHEATFHGQTKAQAAGQEAS